MPLWPRWQAAAGVGACLLVSGCFPHGPTVAARFVRPDLFTPTCAKRVGDMYVVCGSAERVFDDDPETELLDEARLDAQARLADEFHATVVEMSEFSSAHVWTMCGERVLVANFTVPVSAVRVTQARSSSSPSSSRSFQCPDAF